MVTKSSVIFIHGDLQNSTLYSEYAKYFSNKGHKIYPIDLPGHGNNLWNNVGPYEYIENFINQNHIEKPILVSNSSGSSLLSVYIEKTQNVSSCIFINPLLINMKEIHPNIDPESVMGHYHALSTKLFLKQISFDFSLTDNELELEKLGYEHTDPRGFLATMQFYNNLIRPNLLYSLLAPILYFAPTRDEILPLEYHKNQIMKFKNCLDFEIDSKHNFVRSHQQEIILAIDTNYGFITSVEQNRLQRDHLSQVS